MKLYKVNLSVDRGCRYDDAICILYAVDDIDAKEKASDYVNKHLHGEDWATVVNVKQLFIKEDIIVYQNCF